MEARKVVCREIAAPDLEGVVALLTKGFADWRTRDFWTLAIRRLGGRTPPPGLPQYGYLLEAGGAPVGVLLLIASRGPGPDEIRCNVSSWYVEPEFRPFGTLLVQKALRHREATYLNVTPAPETWGLLAAQGYQAYASGRLFAFAALARTGERVRVEMAAPDLQPGDDLSEAEAALLLDHAQWGCLSLLCLGRDGRVPFVFGVRRRRGLVPFAYLIYCRSLASLGAHAKPLGRFLARRGILLLVADAEGPLAGVPGFFRKGHRKYFKGPVRPRPGDLAYTERAIFGT